MNGSKIWCPKCKTIAVPSRQQRIDHNFSPPVILEETYRLHPCLGCKGTEFAILPQREPSCSK